jgi:hypothetical protein
MASEGLPSQNLINMNGAGTLFDERYIQPQVMLNAEVDTNGTLKGFAKITQAVMNAQAFTL